MMYERLRPEIEEFASGGDMQMTSRDADEIGCHL